MSLFYWNREGEAIRLICTVNSQKDKALEAYRIALEKAPGLGHKLDIIFTELRMGFFYDDNDLLSRNIDKAKMYVRRDESAKRLGKRKAELFFQLDRRGGRLG
jgi:hypothetical protein